MQIQITNPEYLHEQGKRDYSEDYIFPIGNDAGKNDKLFLVCDGVGGSTRGDMASKQVCNFFPQLYREGASKLQKHDFSNEELQKTFLNNILKKTEEELDKVVIERPEFRGMATTMTFLNITEESIVIAWAGDSRVYHFGANGKIKDVTTDHSLVQALYDKGEIEKHEIATHPRRNVILRAVSGTESRTKLDVKIIPPRNIEQGDIFFMTTDGVLEAFSDEELETLFGAGYTDMEIKNRMKQVCGEKSKDNFSMYFFRVESISKRAIETVKVDPKERAAAIASSGAPTVTPRKFPISPIKENKKNNPMLYVFLAMLLLLFALGGYYLFQQKYGQLIGWDEKKETFVKDFGKKLEESVTIKEKLALFSNLKNDTIYEKLQKMGEVGIDSIYAEKKQKLENDKGIIRVKVESKNALIEKRNRTIEEYKNESDSDIYKSATREQDSLITLNKQDCEELGTYQVCLDFKKLIPEKEDAEQDIKDSKEELTALEQDDEKKQLAAPPPAKNIPPATAAAPPPAKNIPPATAAAPPPAKNIPPATAATPPLAKNTSPAAAATTTPTNENKVTPEFCKSKGKEYFNGDCYDHLRYESFSGDPKNIAIVGRKQNGIWKYGLYKKQTDGSYLGSPEVGSGKAFDKIFPFVKTQGEIRSGAFARVKRGNRYQFVNPDGVVMRNKHPQKYASNLYKDAEDFKLCNGSWFAKVKTQEDNKEFYLSTHGWLKRDCDSK